MAAIAVTVKASGEAYVALVVGAPPEVREFGGARRAGGG